MKKTLVSFVLVIAAVAVAQQPTSQQSTPSTAPGAAPAQQTAPAQTPPTGQAAPGQQTAPAGQAAPGAQAAPQQPQQKKEIKDPAEYNAYVGAVQQTDPNAKVSGLESFLQQYPNSVMKEDALELLMATYQQTGNNAKTEEAANRVLQANPNNLRALALLAYTKRAAAESGQNAQQNLTQGAQFAQQGLQALNTAPKPEGMSDADWQKLKTQTSDIFHGVIGLAALQNKDYKAAQENLLIAVGDNPNNLRDVYPLSLAFLEDKPINPQGLWFIARAVGLSNGNADIVKYGRSKYVKYHGSDQGWNELVAQAKTTPAVPQGFTVAPAPPPPSPAQQAADLVAKTPVKDMSFADWELILSSGNQQAADQVWNTLKGVPLQLKAQVINATRTRLELAASQDDIDAKRADLVLDMAAPIPLRDMPKVGLEIAVEGIPVSYTPNPFVMTLSKGVLLQAAGPKKKAAPAHRRTRRSQ